MIIVDPVALGDVACTRAAPKWAFDRTGALVQVPVNTLAVTYDPMDLTKAPYALMEPASTNLFLKSNQLNDSLWSKSGVSIPAGAPTIIGVDGLVSAFEMIESAANAPHELRTTSLTLAAGDPVTETIFAKANTRSRLRMGISSVFGPAEQYAIFDLAAGTVALNNLPGSLTATIEKAGYGFWRCRITTTATKAATGTNYIGIDLAGAATYQGDGVSSLFLTRAQHESRLTPTSPIDTDVATASRAADVIAAGAGLAYSNVPITEAPYSTGTTYAKDVLVYDPATYLTYQSAIAGNVGHPLSDTASWLPLGTVVNRRKMLDQYNNTQTTNADEILMVLSPQAISQGLYLGNLYADEVRISVVDKVEGLVYSETSTLIESNSGSSFFNWCFKRIKRRDYFLTLKMPVYANALVTISLRKIGGVAKCGMCAIGPIDEFGPTLVGLSTEGKDYSSTTFNFDGTSSTVIRPYAKRMTCDVMVDNDQIDYLQARLFEIRQKPIVWVGGPYGSTAVYGRYESFKNVIQYATRSLMNLTIGGAV